jgi:hypothetical protein
MSFLAPKVHPTPGSGHDFDNNEDGVTVFYGRDRGEDGVDATNYQTIAHWVNRPHIWIEYFYLFMPELGTWMVYSIDDKRWKQVTEDLIKQEA